MAFVNLKWKKRDSTDRIYIVKRDLKNTDVETLRNRVIRRGELDLGYHFVVRANGNVETGRPEYAHAGLWCDEADSSLAILVDTAGQDKVSMAARKAVKKIAAKYPDAKIVEANITEEMEV